jgi:hypothetical protein
MLIRGVIFDLEAELLDAAYFTLGHMSCEKLVTGDERLYHAVHAQLVGRFVYPGVQLNYSVKQGL